MVTSSDEVAQASSAAEIDIDAAAAAEAAVALDAPDATLLADAASLPDTTVPEFAVVVETAPDEARNLDSDVAAGITARFPSRSVTGVRTSTQSAPTSTSGLAAPTGAVVPVESNNAFEERDAEVATDTASGVTPLTAVPPAPRPAFAAVPVVPTTSPLAPATPPPTLGGFFESLVREFQRAFFNKTPTLAYNSFDNRLVDGHIEGDLNPTDPDSEILTYTTTDPAYGTVEVLSGGSFAYTPGPDYAGHDTFNVTVSDAGNGFQLHGFPALIHLLTFGLLGNDGHTSTATINIGFEQTTVVSGLSQPVDFRFLPDGQIAIAEKTGAIKVVDDGELQSQPIVVMPVSSQNERGIGGIAVDPDFQHNGYLYVAYTTLELRNRLSRITVTDGTGDLESELVLLEADQAIAPNHHGGGLGFGPDNTLYWAVGDNAKPANSQDLSTLHGKIVRVNSDGSVPTDNPPLGPDALPQIYAYGVRNPFRLTFTPDGTLLVADVGAASFEELNNVTAGRNYGWPQTEGFCTDCSSVNPIYAYPRGGGAAISAVLVPSGSTFGTSHDGKVFIADFIKGWIKVLTCNSDYSSCGDEQVFDPEAGLTVKLGLGLDGNIYHLALNPGVLTRIAPSGWSPPAD